MIIELTDETVEKEIAENTLPVVLEFWATWCGPCKSLAPLLEEISEEYTDKIKFFSIDVDRNPHASEAFKIRGIPVMIFGKDGKFVSVLMGRQDRESIIEKLEELLK